MANAYEKFNSVLVDVPVTPGFDIVITQGAASFRFTSPNGKLQVAPVMPWELGHVLAATGTRVHIPEDVADVGDQIQMQSLLKTRKVWIDGDRSQFQAMQKELGPYSEELERAMAPYHDHDRADRARREEEEVRLDAYALAADNALGSTSKTAWKPPELSRILVFSAFSTAAGNVGQANYTAANIGLDLIVRWSRLAMTQTDWVALQWGAVGNLGMRWKAFGSQDFLQMVDDGKNLFTINEACMILKVMACRVEPPELVAAALFDLAGTQQSARGHGPAAEWMPTDVLDASVRVAEAPPKGKPVAAAGAALLAPGTRVQLVGLKNYPEKNGMIGTLVRLLRSGKWHVKFDDPAVEDKMMDARLLETVPSLGPPASKKNAYAIAGNWDNWTPRDMAWDAGEHCFRFRAELGAQRVAKFQLCKGQAGSVKWSGKGKTWDIDTCVKGSAVEGATAVDVLLFVRDSGVVKKVEWRRAALTS